MLSTSSPSVGVAMTPACPNSASRVTAGVAAAAVWDAAALAPASERPASTVSSGIERDSCRAIRANLRGLPKDSRYSTPSRVASSVGHQRNKSLLLTSYLSPTETNEDSDFQPGQVRQQGDPYPAGLHHHPGRTSHGRPHPKRQVQTSCRVRDAEAVRPDQPHAVAPADRQQVGSWSWSRPEVTTTRARVPRRPQSSATRQTATAGTATTARSGGSGSAAGVGKDGTPATRSAFGLTT